MTAAWRALVVGLVALARVAACGGEPPLQDLARLVGADQGVLARAADGAVLVAQAADHAVHPASVTKIATSLALLDHLGPGYRFETRLLAAGPLRSGTLRGDLIVEGGRDPFLVYESAFVMLRELHARGLRTVDGRLLVRGPLLFNWQPDPDGRRLLRTLAGQAGAQAWPAVASLPPPGPRELRDVALAFRRRNLGPPTGSPVTLLTRRSPPLLEILKNLNEFSNNVFHLVSDQIGGPAVVEELARAQVPVAMHDEIVITNAAGAGATNRLSPRAAAGLLDTLAHELARTNHGLPDVLPVSGIDPGTLEKRLPEHRGFVVGKTGTFGSVGASALVGMLRTRKFGTVTFAVLNHGIEVPEARARQDAFVRALIAATDAEAWPYATPAHPRYAPDLRNDDPG